MYPTNDAAMRAWYVHIGEGLKLGDSFDWVCHGKLERVALAVESSVVAASPFSAAQQAEDAMIKAELALAKKLKQLKTKLKFKLKFKLN